MKDSWILNTLPTKKEFTNRQTITGQCYNQLPEHFTKAAIKKKFSESKMRGKFSGGNHLVMIGQFSLFSKLANRICLK